MKERMSIMELKRRFEGSRLSRFSFWTENQGGCPAFEPCWLFLEFSEMQIYDDCGTIFLKSGDSFVEFDLVKFVDIDTEAAPYGTVITVFCGLIGENEEEKSYVLFAS